jgi:hypothetical protein
MCDCLPKQIVYTPCGHVPQNDTSLWNQLNDNVARKETKTHQMFFPKTSHACERFLRRKICNVGTRLVWWDPIVRNFCFLIEYLGVCAGGLYCEIFSICLPIFVFFQIFHIIRCFIKPLLKNCTPTIFQFGTPWMAQILNKI